ncbi:MAG: Gx transporter family protein [Treponema sp.]|nr:Gx transporter family protein [Treponema sp.]
MLTPQPGRAGGYSRSHSALAMLGSLCLFLSAVEYLIPKPLPFMRIGLANLPLLLALDIFGPKDFFLLALLKVLGQGIIGGTLFSWVFLFSVAGTFASASVMYILRRLLGKRAGVASFGFAGLGCAGAMASNGVQLVLARYLVFGNAMRYLAPPFLASGFITGIVLGLVCEYFCRHSQWYSEKAGSGEWKYRGIQEHCRYSNSEPRFLFIAGLLMALIFLLNRSLPGRAAQLFVFCLFVLLSGKKINLLATVMIMAGIIFCNLLAPYGKVLAVFGPLRITQGSLYAGLEKAVTLEGLLMLSRACISSDLKLPGTVGSLLGESLRILELMREKKGLIRRGNVIGGIDRIMREVESGGIKETDVQYTKPQKNVKNIILLCVMVLATVAIGILI